MTYDLKVRENLPCWAGNEKKLQSPEKVHKERLPNM